MGLRDRVNDRITASVAFRVAHHPDGLAAEVAELRQALDVLESSFRAFTDYTIERDKRLDEVQREASWTANELARLAPQAAAFESRLEQLSRPIVVTAEQDDLPEARSLLEAIREEHARVRARLSLVSAYEERLRRLERREEERLRRLEREMSESQS